MACFVRLLLACFIISLSLLLPLPSPGTSICGDTATATFPLALPMSQHVQDGINHFDVMVKRMRTKPLETILRGWLFFHW